MSWERALLDLFDDLETQASGLAQEARDADVADLARAEYAEVTLLERLHGSIGAGVALDLTGATTVRGIPERVGRGCAAVRSGEVPRVLHLVNLEHLQRLSTPSARAAAETALPVTSRLGLASAVRHLADEVAAVSLRLSDGRPLRGDLVRVGADFLELAPADPLGSVDGGGVLVPLRAVVTLAPA
jgi:hypothetical protein